MFTYSIAAATPLPDGLSLDAPFPDFISGTIPITAVSATPYTVTVIATDVLGGASVSQTFDITVVNQAPTIGNLNLGDSNPKTNDVLNVYVNSPADINGDTISYTYVWTVNGNVVQTTPTTSTTDSLDLGQPGHGDKGQLIEVSVTPSDSLNDGVTTTISATVGNTAPTAYDFTLLTRPNVALSAISVADFAGDVDEDILEVTIHEGPNHGTLSPNFDDTFTYTPDTDYVGGDTFAYSVSDGHLASETKTITIHVSLLPQLTLNAQILANHNVQLSGVVSDVADLTGFTVTFYGAINGTTSCLDGTFSFATNDASLGTVYAYVGNDVGLKSDWVSVDLALAAPAITLNVDAVTANSITVSGDVIDIDAGGRTGVISGIANGTAVTDGSGHFSFTGYVLAPGSIYAETTNLWGVTSNTAAQSVPGLPVATSRIISLFSQVMPGHAIELSGQVLGVFTGAVTVTFSGAVTGSTVADSAGYFSYTTNAGALGTVYATGEDQALQLTDTALAVIDVAAPTITFEITDQTVDSVTLTGSVSSLDAPGLTVAIGGVATGSVVTDATGKFTITLAAPEAGNFTATTTDLWGLSSIVALTQFQPGPFTSGPNARGSVPGLAAGVTRSTILAAITRRPPGPIGVPTLPRMPDGFEFSRVTGNATGFRRGVIPANTLLGPSGTGPCVGVIVYPVNDPTLPAYAFHFGFGPPTESPTAAFQREIIDRIPNWAAVRGGYRAVLCGAEVTTGPGAAAINSNSARVLQAAVTGLTSTLQVAIWGYVPGQAVAVDRAGTVYWPLGPSTPIPTTYPLMRALAYSSIFEWKSDYVLISAGI